jgi:hypothetical protein
MIAIMREMREKTALPVKAGMCAECKHAAVKDTKRGTAYLRCTRAEWDDRMVRYPTLPVTSCVGFEPAGAPGSGPQVPGPRQSGNPG